MTRERYSELSPGPAKVQGLANAAAEEIAVAASTVAGRPRSAFLRQFLMPPRRATDSGVANVAGRLLESFRELGKLTGELRELCGYQYHQQHAESHCLAAIARCRRGSCASPGRILEAAADDHRRPARA